MAGRRLVAGAVNGAVDMFGRAIDGVEPQRLAAPAFHVVPRALRHDDALVGGGAGGHARSLYPTGAADRASRVGPGGTRVI